MGGRGAWKEGWGRRGPSWAIPSHEPCHASSMHHASSRDSSSIILFGQGRALVGRIRVSRVQPRTPKRCETNRGEGIHIHFPRFQPDQCPCDVFVYHSIIQRLTEAAQVRMAEAKRRDIKWECVVFYTCCDIFKYFAPNTIEPKQPAEIPNMASAGEMLSLCLRFIEYVKSNRFCLRTLSMSM